MSKIKGGCLCGQIEFEAPDPFLYAFYCHCSECRRFTGAGGSAIGGVPADEFQITKGESHIAQYVKTANACLFFCSTCGSSMYSKRSDTNRIHIRFGSLSSTPSTTPQVHIHTKSKADWYDIHDDLPQFPETPA